MGRRSISANGALLDERNMAEFGREGAVSNAGESCCGGGDTADRRRRKDQGNPDPGGRKKRS